MGFRLLNAEQTAECLPFPELMASLRRALQDYAAGIILAPERQVVPLSGGTMLSMPSAAPDLAAHKLVNVCAGNNASGLPTIQGQVTAYDAQTGTPLFALDAPTVTARRTAAISMLGIQLLHGLPHAITLIGTGGQAAGHVAAMAATFPDAQIWVKGSNLERAAAFCESHRGNLQAVAEIPANTDVVITTTTSRTPVYDLPAQAGRLVIGVGAFTPDAAEISAETVLASQLYVDDLAGAHHEAGDLIQAGVNWDAVHALAEAIRQKPPHNRAILLKTVGCAAWDLAACRVAREFFG